MEDTLKIATEEGLKELKVVDLGSEWNICIPLRHELCRIKDLPVGNPAIMQARINGIIENKIGDTYVLMCRLWSKAHECSNLQDNGAMNVKYVNGRIPLDAFKGLKEGDTIETLTLYGWTFEKGVGIYKHNKVDYAVVLHDITLNQLGSKFSEYGSFEDVVNENINYSNANALDL